MERVERKGCERGVVRKGIFQARILEQVAISSSGDLSNPGIKPRPLALQADSEPSGKPKNTGVGRLLLRGIFPTQELNWGLLHCRHILYQPSYQGSPVKEDIFLKPFVLYWGIAD